MRLVRRNGVSSEAGVSLLRNNVGLTRKSRDDADCRIAYIINAHDIVKTLLAQRQAAASCSLWA